MAETRYLSEGKLGTLATRIAQVFAEKPIVAQFILATTDWQSDSTTGKYKASVAIDKDFNASTMGDINLDLGSLNTVAARIEVEEAAAEANVKLLDITTATVEGQTVGVIVLYADKVPSVTLPFLVTMIGQMPTT